MEQLGWLATDVVRRGDAGDSVPDDDDVPDRRVDVRAGLRSRPGEVGLFRRQRDRHRTGDSRRARHARVRCEAEPLERHPFLVADGREVLGAAHDADRVRATDAHPAAGLDRKAVTLDDVE